MAKRNGTAKEQQAVAGGLDWLAGTGAEQFTAEVCTLPSWKPEVGEAKAFVVNGFVKKHSDEYDNDYLLWNCTDLKSGEQFNAIFGGLFDFWANEGEVVSGDKFAVRYKGKKKMTNGNMVKDWEIVRLK